MDSKSANGEKVNNNGNNGNNNNNNENNNEGNAIPVGTPLPFDEAKEAMAAMLISPEFAERGNSRNTIRSLEELRAINRNGLITTSSQEGVNKEEFYEATKLFIKSKERGYLTGFMRLSRGGKFMDWINSNTDKIAFRNATLSEADFDAHITRFQAHTGSASWSSFVPSIVVTLENSSEISFENIVSLYPYSRATLIGTQSQFDSGKRAARIAEEEEVIEITLIDPVYGRRCTSPEGLYADVMKGLAAIPDDVPAANASASAVAPNKGGFRRATRTRGSRRTKRSRRGFRFTRKH